MVTDVCGQYMVYEVWVDAEGQNFLVTFPRKPVLRLSAPLFGRPRLIDPISCTEMNQPLFGRLAHSKLKQSLLLSTPN